MQPEVSLTVKPLYSFIHSFIHLEKMYKVLKEEKQMKLFHCVKEQRKLKLKIAKRNIGIRYC